MPVLLRSDVAGCLALWTLLGLFLSAENAHGQNQPSPPFYFGADLSYVNEMEDCGGTYREQGQVRDPFELFARHGTHITRVRLWHTPTWTSYSTLADVQKTIRRARAAGMAILLDFHYSDEWADPGKQFIPEAWTSLDFDTLADSLYQYTYAVLNTLASEDLLPEMVQVGNEINHGMLWPQGSTENWVRLGTLLNAAIRAVRDVSASTGQPVQVMLHVAQPEHVDDWLEKATTEGQVNDFDIIGLSYYANWSTVPLLELSTYIKRFKQTYGRDIVVAETAYPWTLDGSDEANNILEQAALEEGYPATPIGQKRYLIALTQAIINGDGSGIIYWEPAWISTSCSTRWGKGSHWENATFFDFNRDNEVLPGITYPRFDYAPPGPTRE